MSENGTTTRALPAGFVLETVETETSGVKYTVSFPKAESLQAVLDAYRELQPEENPEEILLAIWNAGNAQGAKQGPKAAVRDAVNENGADSNEVQEAIAKAQASARLFIQGAPRAGGGGGKRHESGLTAKQRTELGTEVALEIARTGKAPSQARMTEIAKKLGIDPETLGA